MKTTKKAALALALVLAAGGSFALTRSAPHASKLHASPSETAERGPSPSSSETGSSDDTKDLRLARAITYAVTSRHALAAGDGKEMNETTIGGRLVLAVVAATDGNAVIRGQLEDATRIDRPTIEAPAGLGAEFFFVLRPDGTIVDFGFPKTIPADSRRELRAIVSALEIVSGGARPGWSAKESDGTGDFNANYTRAGAAIAKVKSGYALVRTPQGLVSPSSIGATYAIRGGTQASLGAGNWPSDLAVDETITVAFKEMRLALVEKFQAKLVASGERRDLVGTYEKAKASFDPDVDGLAEAAAIAARNADVGLVKNASLDALVGELTSSKAPRGRNVAVARLGALFRVHPESIAPARTTLLAKDTPEITARHLAAALGGAGTPEAQRALGDALGSKTTTSGVKNEAAISLGLVDKPTAEAKSALVSAAKSSDPDVATTATLALGNLAKSSGDDASDVVDDLVAKLATAGTVPEKALLIDALGNSGSPRALDAILAFVRAPDSELRVAAVGALKFLGDERVVQSLRLSLHDADSRVRMAALSAIGQQSPVPFLEGLGILLAHDEDAQVRLLAVRVLARTVNDIPELEAVLARVSTSDADPKVREAATAALSREASVATR